MSPPTDLLPSMGLAESEESHTASWTTEEGEAWASEALESIGVKRIELTRRYFPDTMARLGVDSMGWNALLAEKYRVRLELQRYDHKFYFRCGRLPTQAEKQPMKLLYAYYQYLRCRIGQMSDVCGGMEAWNRHSETHAKVDSMPVGTCALEGSTDAKPTMPICSSPLKVQVLAPPGLSTPSGPDSYSATSTATSSSWRTFFRPPLGFSQPPGLSTPQGMSKRFWPPPEVSLASQGSDHATMALETPRFESAASASAACNHIDWCIEKVLKKLRLTCGHPLTSPVFTVAGVSGLRLIFAPGEAWATIARNRDVKGKTAAKAPKSRVTMASVYGTLKLKLVDAQQIGVLRFDLFVGGVRHGTFECDFSERVVQDCELVSDWLEAIDLDQESLSLRLEFY
eukprot:CAMPEP_0117472446 /NCGR_PEP_ID=MMETSP0784-20121206/8251_1 /TAXON_ID=39447 /ORGANISM="" /LENGTH=397 /DNA_ID=CAMNT_0005266597 /DNA_START=63 /DNA_END=1256 /DNA_ORIENTATION=-